MNGRLKSLNLPLVGHGVGHLCVDLTGFPKRLFFIVFQDGRVRYMAEVDKLCEILSLTELEDLNNQLNSVNAKRQSELEQLAICQQSNLELENRLKQADNVVQGLFKRTLCDADELGCLKRNSETLARDNQTLVAKFQAQEQRFHDLMQKLKALHDNVKEVRATSETP